MPQDTGTDIEPDSAHDPALADRHAAGVRQERQSPADRQLAPEGDAPMQSSTAIADDGLTYVGQGGGYAGGESAPPEGQDERERGAGTYGYPTGAGVGIPGGDHDAGRDTNVAPDPTRPGRA